MVNGNFEAPIDLIPGGVNPGIFLLIIEQEDDGDAHLFHSKQKAKLYRRKLMDPMNHDAAKGLILCNINGSFAALYFLGRSSAFFSFLRCEGNHDFFELLTGRRFGKTEKRAFLCLFQHVNKELLLRIALTFVDGRRRNIQLDKQADSFEKMVLILLQGHVERLADSSFVQQLLESSRESAVLLNPEADVVGPLHIDFFVLDQLIQRAD